MSFFGSQCCGKGVEGENEESPPAGRRAAAKKRCKIFFRKMSFWRLEGCGRGVGGDFARNWLRFGARCEKAPAVGSVLAPKS